MTNNYVHIKTAFFHLPFHVWLHTKSQEWTGILAKSVLIYRQGVYNKYDSAYTPTHTHTHTHTFTEKHTQRRREREATAAATVERRCVIKRKLVISSEWLGTSGAWTHFPPLSLSLRTLTSQLSAVSSSFLPNSSHFELMMMARSLTIFF